VTACRACGTEGPEGARFCPACGASLAPAPPMATERKVVTTLFADLVGFTALGERHDPEDVDAALRGYYALARTIIERFGGVVEKFIGDAVVGLFGVPLAHEDDAERAVRAALEIVAHLDELPAIGDERLEVRAAVNTGPALVRLHARPGAGEGALVGDAVNTASRLLAEAPPMGVVVGEMTHRLTSRAIAYEGMAARSAKGKAKPIERWLARGPIAQSGTGIAPSTTPMIGREVELGVLLGLLDKAVASRSPQYALIEGEAGLGKTRLVREMLRRVDERPGFFCTWRQGRCPAYGDGLAFWALGEIVAGHAGILQSDGPEAAEDKLEKALGDGERDEWLLARLRPLVGLPAPQIDRDDAFAAWLQFVLGVARARPTVLVFEDVHWANDATLAFLRHLVEHARGVPLLVLATARPEFHESHPRIAGYASLTAIRLRALSADESARMASALPGARRNPDVIGQAVTRCGGNPLFTEEFVRFMAERPAPAATGDPAAEEAEAGIPDSLQTLISARLDALPPDRKALMSDASVVGQVFWPGALAAMHGQETRETPRILEELEHHELIRALQSSSIAGEREYSFWHALICDVAYARLPRSARAVKHAAVAQWIESFAEARTNLAEVRAYHYSAAVELAHSAHDATLAEEVRLPALLSQRDAGDRMLSIDVAAAARHYDQALALARSGDELSPHLSVALAEAKMRAGDLDAAVRLFKRGIDGLMMAGDRRAAAVAMTRLSAALHWQDLKQDPQAQELQSQALRLLEDAGPSPELVTVLEERAVQSVHEFRQADAIRFADEAIGLSERLGLATLVRALAYRGVARCETGDAEGLHDLRRSWELALERGDGLGADTACQLLSEADYPFEGPEASSAIVRMGLEQATRRGMDLTVMWFRSGLVQFDRLSGNWQLALQSVAELEGLMTDPTDLIDVRTQAAAIRLQQGDVETAIRHLDWSMSQAPSDVYTAITDLAMRSAIECRQGAASNARPLLAQLEELTRGRRGMSALTTMLPLVIRAAASADALDVARLILPSAIAHRRLERCASLTLAGFENERVGRIAAAEADFAAAASSWAEFGDPFEAALARMDRGRCLLCLQQPSPAASALATAREVFAELEATPALNETERLLSQTA
jgi:class 3 adenylate cyclase/tetratricopeptide (TPR) repeat protein